VRRRDKLFKLRVFISVGARKWHGYMIRYGRINAEYIAEVEGIIVLIAKPVWLADKYLRVLDVVFHSRFIIKSSFL
jgi:hypothetical protein